MTILKINPFNLKAYIRSKKPVKHVEIPTELPKKLGNKLLAMQGSLDYMATNYGINFEIIHLPFEVNNRKLSVDKVTCKWKDNTSDTELIHADLDDKADVAKNIYLTVSNMLKSEKQKKENKLYGVNVQDIPDILKPTFKIYSGILEYYAKKYDGMTFTATGVNEENSIVDTNPPQIKIACEYGSKKSEMTLSKVDHAVHTSKENAFYTNWGHNLVDFYEDEKYEEIHQMVANVLKGENS